MKRKIQRRTGRTTRLVDKAIQDLFIDGFITVYDHFGTVDSNQHLKDLIMNRMEAEHPLDKIHTESEHGVIIITLID